MIRRATIQDLDSIRYLFYDTITNVNTKNYNQEQINAWASGYNKVESWTNKLKEQHFFVTETENMITGFASVTDAGYIDFLFVHKNFQRRGIALLLFKTIENFARQQNLKELTADVSITAKLFFENQGFALVKEQLIEIKGVTLNNYKMTKKLP